jgi:biopolymer transport protein ExbB
MNTRLTIALCAVWLLCAAASAQTPPPTTQEQIDAKVAAQQKNKSLLDIYTGGGFWMHPILLTSLAAVAFTGFCTVMVRKSRIMPPQLLNDLNNLLQQRQVSQAHQVCLAQNNPLASVIAAAVVKANFDAPMFNKPAMEAAAAEALAAEEAKLGIWVNYLNVCAQIAPMLGLFGTVVGMIEAFNQLAAGKAEPSDLAGGIGVAMTTTAGGLLVAIPAMCLYFFFRGQLTSIMTDLQKSASRMLDLFTGEMNPDGTRPPTGHTMQIPTR